MKAAPLLLLGLSLWLALTPSSYADYEPVSSGATRLTLDKAFLRLMGASHVKLSAVAPATMKGGVVTFPVRAGKMDPTSGQGTIEHDGALRLTSPGGSIPLRALQLKTTRRRLPFAAKAGGGQLKVGLARSLTWARAGFAERIDVKGLTLSAKLATRLAKKLRLKGAIREGIPIGSSRTVANPESVSILNRGSVSVELDPGFKAKLDSLFVAVNPIFPAEHPGPFTLPIFAGKLSPDAQTGSLETKGALELLQLGGGQIFWVETRLDFDGAAFVPEVDVEPAPPYAGKMGSILVGGLSLPAGSVTANPRSRTISVAGTALTMDVATAALFNEVSAKPQGREDVFIAGEAVANISFVATGQ
jgi:hypothetical protein